MYYSYISYSSWSDLLLYIDIIGGGIGGPGGGGGGCMPPPLDFRMYAFNPTQIFTQSMLAEIVSLISFPAQG